MYQDAAPRKAAAGETAEQPLLPIASQQKSQENRQLEEFRKIRCCPLPHATTMRNLTAVKGASRSEALPGRDSAMFRSIVAAVAIAAVLATPARAEETELEDLIAAYIQSFAPIPAAALQVAQDLTAIAQAQEALDNALAQAENGNGDPALIDQLGLALVAAIQQYDADVQTLANLVGGTEVLLAAVWKPNADRAKIVSFVPGIRPTIVGGIQLNITTAPRVQVEARVWGDGSQQFGYFQLVEISGEDRVHVGGSLNPILFPNPAGIIWPNAELAWDHIDLPQRGLGETAIFVLEVYDDEGHLLDVSAQFSATF